MFQFAAVEQEQFETGSAIVHDALDRLRRFSEKEDRDREGSVGRLAIEFFSECLSPANRRPSAAQLLQHPFLANILPQV